MAKTSVHLNYASSIWPVVEKWAAENHYLLETHGESTRLYLRESKDASATINVAISQVDAGVKISAWFSDLIRKELAIDLSSIYAALPRKEAVSEIQELLAALGSAPASKAKTSKKSNAAFKLGRSLRKLSGKK